MDKISHFVSYFSIKFGGIRKLEGLEELGFVILCLMIKYLIGIDEVGRGPLAGPITFCAFCVPVGKELRFLRGIKSSKKMNEKNRMEWVRKINEKAISSGIRYAISSVSANSIDKYGISYSNRLAIKRILKKLGIEPNKCRIFLDGGLKAPKDFIFQKTIVRGDEKIKIISCASVVAKVKRDKVMVRMAKKFKEYNFEKNKGYGTEEHLRALREHGPCEIHRKSFLKKILT